MAKNTIPVRIDPMFKKFLEDISVDRMKLGKDKRQKSLPRLSLAISRSPDIAKILREARIDD